MKPMVFYIHCPAAFIVFADYRPGRASVSFSVIFARGAALPPNSVSRPPGNVRGDDGYDMSVWDSTSAEMSLQIRTLSG